MEQLSNIVITWPKSRPLESYLAECERANGRSHFINFRVPRLPRCRFPGQQCFVVHDGYIRGWQYVVDCVHKGDHQVTDPLTGAYWPAGYYIVRDPTWHGLRQPIEMKGFQGWRYYQGWGGRPEPYEMGGELRREFGG